MNKIELLKDVEIDGKGYFMPDKSDMKVPIYFFMYRINIENRSRIQLKLLTRHWEIIDANGKVEIVDGKGVVGETPILNPGDNYSYNSFCPLRTQFGSMQGFYTFSHSNSSEIYKTIIPKFSLVVPSQLN